MRLTRDLAEDFARAWVQAWNDRDLDAILIHYAENVVFHSPRIAAVMETDASCVVGKPALRAYWSRALERASQLYFELDDILVGADALTIIYINHRDEFVAETFLFNDAGEVIQSIATYR